MAFDLTQHHDDTRSTGLSNMAEKHLNMFKNYQRLPLDTKSINSHNPQILSKGASESHNPTISTPYPLSRPRPIQAIHIPAITAPLHELRRPDRADKLAQLALHEVDPVAEPVLLPLLQPPLLKRPAARLHALVEAPGLGARDPVRRVRGHALGLAADEAEVRVAEGRRVRGVRRALAEGVVVRVAGGLVWVLAGGAGGLAGDGWVRGRGREGGGGCHEDAEE